MMYKGWTKWIYLGNGVLAVVVGILLLYRAGFSPLGLLGGILLLFAYLRFREFWLVRRANL